MNDMSKTCSTQAELAGQLSMYFARSGAPPDFSDLLRSYLGSVACFADDVCAEAAPFSPHIPVVVEVGSQKQMGRVYARWVVAVVANHHAWRDRAKVQFPREAMSVATNSFTSSSRTEIPVALRLSVSGPQPTSRLLLDLTPESLNRRPDSPRVVPDDEPIPGAWCHTTPAFARLGHHLIVSRTASVRCA